MKKNILEPATIGKMAMVMNIGCIISPLTNPHIFKSSNLGLTVIKGV